MPVEGVIVLILTVLGFVGILVWMLVGRRFYAWPDGYRRVEGRCGKYRVTLLVRKDLPQSRMAELAKRCAQALSSLSNAWMHTYGISKKQIVPYWAVCWLKTDAEFEKDVASWGVSYPVTKPAAYSRLIPAKTGSRSVPAGVVRERYFLHILETGQPFVHEMTHHLLHAVHGTWDHDHVYPGAWDRLKSRFELLFDETVCDET